MQLLNYLLNRIAKWKQKSNKFMRTFFIAKKKKRIAKTGDTKVPSVVCNNCNGAMVLHEFGLPFNSPFVNLWIPPSDYIYLLQHLKELISKEIIDVSDKYPNIHYPIGELGGKVTLYFMHYKTFSEAIETWKRRTARMDFNNLRIILVERDGTTIEHLRQFDQLPYPHKVSLTHSAHYELKSCFALKGCTDKEKKQLAFPYEFSGWFGRKYYDQFNWVQFLFGNKK